MNKDRSDREAEDLQRMEFCSELSNLGSLSSYQSTQSYRIMASGELRSGWGLVAFPCAASVLFSSDNKHPIHLRQTSSVQRILCFLILSSCHSSGGFRRRKMTWASSPRTSNALTSLMESGKDV